LPLPPDKILWDLTPHPDEYTNAPPLKKFKVKFKGPEADNKSTGNCCTSIGQTTARTCTASVWKMILLVIG
jgi:hypothetical protein